MARGLAAFAVLGPELGQVSTPIGDAWILATDEPTFRAPGAQPAPARRLPSGDAFWLFQGRDRELLVPNADRRSQLYTPRVWPGAVLNCGEIAGVWRRDAATVAIEARRRLLPPEREAVAASRRRCRCPTSALGAGCAGSAHRRADQSPSASAGRTMTTS